MLIKPRYMIVISLHSFFYEKRRILNKDFVIFIVIKLTSNFHSYLFRSFGFNFIYTVDRFSQNFGAMVVTYTD